MGYMEHIMYIVVESISPEREKLFPVALCWLCVSYFMANF